MNLIDINNLSIQQVLPQLLIDKTSKKNILWATNSYNYPANSEILIEQLSYDSIKPCVQKSFEDQRNRVKSFAEVFTPSWICNQMNNYADEIWFEQRDVFNVEQNQYWTPTESKIKFSENKPWTEYIYSTYLEITCGEAPFIVSRYDTVTGDMIPIKSRIGILDRKLRVINENTNNEKDWLLWATRAFQSVYGYEFQGDNLLIARINLLMTFIEYLQDRWNRQPNKEELESISNIIVWNIWQMDKFSNTIPFSKPTENRFDLLNRKSQKDNDCLVYDWRRTNSPLKYKNIERKNNIKFDFVVGNPPYQLESNVETTNGQKPRKNIFHLFQIEADKISSNGTVLIYPGGRWLQQSGKGVKSFGKNQLNDNKLQKVIMYSDSKQVFKNVSISDGITIVLKNNNKDIDVFEYIYIEDNSITSYKLMAPGEQIIPLNPKYFDIISKIRSVVVKNNLKYLSSSIFPRSLFGIESSFVERNPNMVVPYKGQTLESNEVKLLTNDKEGSAGRAKWYVTDRANIPRGMEFISKYKVIVSSSNAGGQKGNNQIEVLDDKSAFGRSRIALKMFDTLTEAKNFYSYCSSYFIRFTFLLTDEALGTLGKLVPDFIDYSNEQKKINFSCNIDDQLYKIFDISKDEQKIIEETVNNVRKN